MLAVLLASHGVVSLTARPDAHQAADTSTPTMSPRLPARAEDIADYTISVKLDPDKKQLTGKQQLTWRNTSADAIGDLWFHLYLNAFRNSDSTFFRESRGQLRDDEMPEDGWGWIDVDSMTLRDGGAGGATGAAGANVDLKASMRFEAPDDGNKEDRTVARVTLPRPLQPGESVTLDIAFTAQLPKVFARTGYVRDYFLVGQWFPKIAVYEPAGMRGRATGGWNCHQFHGHSEFYADFGRYRVDITLPSNFVVGATGVRAERRDNRNGTSTHVYEQENVHDFAWTASPHFVEQRRTFVASREVTQKEYADAGRLLDRDAEEMRLQDVEVILLMQPEHMPQVERHFKAAMLSIKWFGLLYGRYPHRTITIVDPASGADGSGGMEYPTFITAGTAAYMNDPPFDHILVPEMTVVHEFGHQYWYGMVGSNEFEEAWLDEGINSYSSGRVMAREYGASESVGRIAGVGIAELDMLRIVNTVLPYDDVIRQPAWEYRNDLSYGFNSYFKPEIVLNTLERILGEPTMARAMRAYFARWQFRHPNSDDFYQAIEQSSGQDLSGFFHQLIETPETLDYEVSSLSSEPAGSQQRSSVHLRRNGKVVLPVELELKFEGAPPERTTWQPKEEETTLTFDRATAIEWARLDPDSKLLVDKHWLNNGRRAGADSRVASSWTSRWMFWLQHAFAFLGL
jgi:hypothetical protein